MDLFKDKNCETNRLRISLQVESQTVGKSPLRSSSDVSPISSIHPKCNKAIKINCNRGIFKVQTSSVYLIQNKYICEPRKNKIEIYISLMMATIKKFSNERNNTFAFVLTSNVLKILNIQPFFSPYFTCYRNRFFRIKLFKRKNFAKT